MKLGFRLFITFVDRRAVITTFLNVVQRRFAKPFPPKMVALTSKQVFARRLTNRLARAADADSTDTTPFVDTASSFADVAATFADTASSFADVAAFYGNALHLQPDT